MGFLIPAFVGIQANSNSSSIDVKLSPSHIATDPYFHFRIILIVTGILEQGALIAMISCCATFK